ncbi:MAG: SpoIIIAH-like family protein [Clostridiales bacterium]|nr:SpoIIIAH-like family protein [Clostridiales bacterium]
MKLWKRNVVVAAIVLFVCVAVYLNWTYDQEAAVSTSGETSASALASEDGDTETKTLGEAALVSSDDSEAAEETSGDTEEIVIDSWDSAEVTEETVSETGDSSGYFAEARLSREEARASALSILQETVDDPEASDAAVSAAAESIAAMASATLAESQIESLVAAKGYPECVAFIGDNSVSVVVSTESGELSGADVAKITDIVLGETDFSASSVKVVLAED